MNNLSDFINNNADLWCMENRTLKGKPYRFDGITIAQKRQFLRQPLRDTSIKKCFQKSRQAGMSETQVSELMYLCSKYNHKKFMYLFPTNYQMVDFVQTRINPTIENSPNIRNYVTRNSVKSKHIFNCDVLFRTGSVAKAGEGADIDGLFIDERDRMNASILDAFKEGLSSSDLKLIRDISTPSLPGVGINISFENSDKKHWFVKCEACGTRQSLEFPKSIVYVKSEGIYEYRCLHCKAVGKLNRNDGKWIPQVTQIKTDYSGYQISQLDCPWITADEIMKKRKNISLPQFFFNYVLGKPYAGSNLLILQPDINNCIVNDLTIVTKSGKMIMGVDWGDISYVIIGMNLNDKFLIIHYESINDRDPEQHIIKVAGLMENFNIDIGVFDAGYGKDRNAALYKLFRGRIWACTYIDSKKSTLIENEWNTERYYENSKTTVNPRVKANRTVSLKVMARGWKTKDIILPLNLLITNEQTETFFSHLKALAIKWEEVGEGKAIERIGTTGDDHYAHAMNYAYIGFYKTLERTYSSVGFMDLSSVLPVDIQEGK